MGIVKVNSLENSSSQPVVTLNTDGTTRFYSSYDPGGFTLPTWTDETTRPSTNLIPFSMGYNMDKRQAELFAGFDDNGRPLWYKLPTSVRFGGVSTYNDMVNLNSALSSYTYNQVSQIRSEFEGYGYTLIATPTYNGMAENMGAQTGTISSLGVFNRSEFDSGSAIELSSGFADNGLNGMPSMIFAGFGPNGYEGIAFQGYRTYGSGTALKNFFSPNQNRELAVMVIDKNGNERSAATGQSTIYSDNQQPNSNGYYQNNRFAADDGSWGFRFGANRIDGNGGPYLSANSSDAYGVENRNGGDASNSDFFFGSASTSSSSQGFYFFIKKV
jgi:hypothetical protein